MDEYIAKLQNRENLTEAEIQAVMRLIMRGEVPTSLIEEFLVAMNRKGPTVEEITGAAKILRVFATSVKTKHPVVLDTCGTGGDKMNTFNISTVTAFVVAAGGVIVAKHGNRSISSRCGSADLLEAMGVCLNIPDEKLGECLDTVGMAFLFAQRLHPAMKNVATARRNLGVQTIFNILGPLLNPARATHQLMGVYQERYVEPLAHVLKNLGLQRAMVVHGSDGLDEITTTGKSWVAEFTGEEVIRYEVDPQEYGIRLAHEYDLKGGESTTNLAIAQDILQGGHGFKRDIVVLNAAFAFYCAEKVRDIYAGVHLAEHILDTGKAFAKLEELKVFTQTNRIKENELPDDI